MSPLALSILDAMERYPDKTPVPYTREDISLAVLSGVSLTCDYLIKNDGSEVVNAHSILNAVEEIVSGREDVVCGKIPNR